MARQRWIIVPNWDRFQHYRRRNPIWIKIYTELLHDDAFRGLSQGDRGVLVGIWLLYASKRRALREDTASLSRELGMRTTSAQLARLNHAGFIHLSASNPLAKCSTRARARSREEVLRTSKEAASATRRRRAPAASQNGPPPCEECGVGQGLHSAECSKAGVR